jgi:hypothetical protein
MQGVEVVDRILAGAPEPTLTCPDMVNRGYNPLPDRREQVAELLPFQRTAHFGVGMVPSDCASPLLCEAQADQDRRHG